MFFREDLVLECTFVELAHKTEKKCLQLIALRRMQFVIASVELIEGMPTS